MYETQNALEKPVDIEKLRTPEIVGYNPLIYDADIIEERTPAKIYCGCPCPEVSAPIFAAGLLMFDPLD